MLPPDPNDDLPEWDDMEWGNLLLKISSGSVIPVIGPDLMQVEISEQDAALWGRPTGYMMLESYLTLRVASMWEKSRKQPLISPKDLPEVPRFNDLICLFLDRNGPRESVDNFYGYVTFQWKATKIVHSRDEVLPAGSIRVSPAIECLAKIKDFRLFVTTTGDQIIESALKEHRPRTPPWMSPPPLSGSPSFTKGRPSDLPALPEGSDAPVVYHLFGSYSAEARSFVLTEDDLLDYVVSLQSRDLSLGRLTDALRSNQLLVLGGGFNDWLTRFFLRTVKPQLATAEEVLADKSGSDNASLRHFLRRFSPKTTVVQGGGAGFVTTLYEKWKALNQVEVSAAAVPLPAVVPQVMPSLVAFISYSSRNRAIARRLHQQLKDIGVDAWFDVEQLEAGDNWAQKIKLNIQRCTVFLPLVSRDTEGLLDAYFRREWAEAVDRATRKSDSIAYIIPLLIEPGMSRNQVEHVPEAFRKAQWGKFEEEGVIPESYLHEVKNAHERWLAVQPKPTP